MRILATIRGSNYSLEFRSISSQNETLRSILVKDGIDLTPVNGWHPKRQQEWIAGRYLIKERLEHPLTKLIISSSGKPYFPDSSKHFSISHSSDLIGIGISQLEIGIDIQISSKSIEKTAHKFISDDDIKIMSSDLTTTEKKHYIWTIKEAIFKSYGLGNVDFKNDILIKNSRKNTSTNQVSAELKLENKSLLYNIDLFKINNYYIAIALPKSKAEI